MNLHLMLHQSSAATEFRITSVPTACVWLLAEVDSPHVMSERGLDRIVFATIRVRTFVWSRVSALEFILLEMDPLHVLVEGVLTRIVLSTVRVRAFEWPQVYRRLWLCLIYDRGLFVCLLGRLGIGQFDPLRGWLYNRHPAN